MTSKKQSSEKDPRRESDGATAIPLGAGVGVALGAGVGAALGDLAIGAGIGVALGAAFGSIFATVKSR